MKMNYAVLLGIIVSINANDEFSDKADCDFQDFCLLLEQRKYDEACEIVYCAYDFLEQNKDFKVINAAEFADYLQSHTKPVAGREKKYQEFLKTMRSRAIGVSGFDVDELKRKERARKQELRQREAQEQCRR